MKENAIFYSAMGLVVVFIVIGWFLTTDMVGIFLPDYAGAATSSQVAVSASITALISCSTNITGTGTDFPILTSSAISTSTPNASTTMSCANAGLGCTLSINDLGGGSPTPQAGLWNSTSSALIESPNMAFSATTTLSADTEGFGIRATSTATGSGGTLGVALRYDISQTKGLAGSVNDVGGLATTTLTLASSTEGITNREIVVTHKAAASSTSPGGTYDDTITYSCAENN